MYFLKRIEGDQSDPQGMAKKIVRFFEWMKEKSYSPNTIESYGQSMVCFSRWCAERGIGRPQEVTRTLMERYCRFVNSSKRIKDGQSISYGLRFNRINAVCTFFRWLARSRQILYNPAAEIEFPRRPFQLPRQVFSIAEVERVLNQADLGEFMGLRDRAMMEVLYSTGIRRSELCRLKVCDVEMDKGWLKVEQGKYYQDRVVPIGERALMWLEKYLSELRPLLAWREKGEWLFLTRDGKPLRPKHLTRVLHEHVARSGLGKSGACHIFRHTMATLMLEGGADIRFIQEMLGHASLETTKIYTKVSIGKLKEVHEQTHPGAKLERREPDKDVSADEEAKGSPRGAQPPRQGGTQSHKGTLPQPAPERIK